MQYAQQIMGEVRKAVMGKVGFFCGSWLPFWQEVTSS